MVVIAALYPAPSSLCGKEAPANSTWGRETLRPAGIYEGSPNVGSLSFSAYPSWRGCGNYRKETKKGKKIKRKKEG